MEQTNHQMAAARILRAAPPPWLYNYVSVILEHSGPRRRSRWFEDRVGRRIATVADGLSPAVLAAAQERGQACDLWQTAQEVMGLLRSGFASCCDT